MITFYLLLMSAHAVLSSSLRSTSEVLSSLKQGNEVIVTLLHNHQIYRFEMPIDSKLFHPSVEVLTGNDPKPKQWKTKHSYLQVQQSHTWGSATVSEDGVLISGVFSVAGTLLHVSKDKASHLVRELTELDVRDITVEIPGRANRTKIILPPTIASGNAFFPGCYPGDSTTHSFAISISLDWGFVQRTQTQVGGVQAAVENVMTLVRPLYLAQLNVEIQLERIVIGQRNSDPILSRSPGAATCVDDPMGTLDDFRAWVGSKATPSGFWMMLTDCFPAPGVVGIAHIGGLCAPQGYNSGLSSWTYSLWLTFAHELGHGFGALHTFYNGMGGIMDYGNGQLFGGPVSFHPDNRQQMCEELTYATTCPSFIPVEDSCGNGVLEPSEECECIKLKTTSCGKCQECKLTSPAQCSIPSDGFMVLQPGITPDFAPVSSSFLADSECCTNNKLITVVKSCNQVDVCSTSTGQCEQACSRFQLPPCGFDTSGCLQLCMLDTFCRGIDLTTMSSPFLPAGMVPDGNVCSNGKGLGGTCKSGTCVPTSLSGGDGGGGGGPMTNQPSNRPVMSLTTKQPQALMGSVSKSPTKPTHSPTTPFPSSPPTKFPTSASPTTKFPAATTTLYPTTAAPTTGFPTKTLTTTTMFPTSASPTTGYPTKSLVITTPTTTMFPTRPTNQPSNVPTTSFPTRSKGRRQRV